MTKQDVYAAAQDLGERLARQIEINQVLRAERTTECIEAHKLEIELAGANEEIGKLQKEITALASRPCLECDTVTPVRIADLCKLLRQADSLIQAFPRHYAAASETDASASMIQHDRWQAFQEHCAKVCAKIRNCLHDAQNAV
jgi:hypothetical protein